MGVVQTAMVPCARHPSHAETGEFYQHAFTGKKIPIFPFFSQNGRIIRPFWEKMGKFGKHTKKIPKMFSRFFPVLTYIELWASWLSITIPTHCSRMGQVHSILDLPWFRSFRPICLSLFSRKKITIDIIFMILWEFLHIIVGFLAYYFDK